MGEKRTMAAVLTHPGDKPITAHMAGPRCSLPLLPPFSLRPLQSVTEREALREAQKAFVHRGPPWYFVPVRALSWLLGSRPKPHVPIAVLRH